MGEFQLVRETTKTAPVVIRVDDLARSIAAELQEQNFGIEATDTGEAYVKASPLALSRALRNLFINAATHGGNDLVSVTDVQRRGLRFLTKGRAPLPEVFDQVFDLATGMSLSRRDLTSPLPLPLRFS